VVIGVLGDMVVIFIVDEAGPSEMLITTYKTTENIIQKSTTHIFCDLLNIKSMMM
jgi:hypothetical protein